MKKMIAVFMFSVSVATSAHAVIINNTDSEPHTLIVSNGGVEKEITLPPQGRFDSYGMAIAFRLSDQKSDQYGHGADEFTIWPGGKMGLQKRSPAAKDKQYFHR